MTWNYRVIRHGDEDYRVHEVYYSDKGVPESWTIESMDVVGESPGEIEKDLVVMLDDLRRHKVLRIVNHKLVPINTKDRAADDAKGR